MGDKGLATWVDWSARRETVMKQAQAGIAAQHGGNQVYFDLVVDRNEHQPMRFVFMLFEQVPLAFANFHALCTHSEPGLGEAKHMLTYRRSGIHRISKGQFFEGGDITLGNGTGGDSIYGAGGFEPEGFGLRLRHDAAGLLSMVTNHGVCQSRFRVSFGANPSLDEGEAIVGRLVSGAMHLPTIEALPVDAADRPVRALHIVECGVIPGFAKLPPPLPPAEKVSVSTMAAVGAVADGVRSGVVDALKEALQSSGGAGAGGGEVAGTSDKKRAASPSGADAAPKAKRSALGAAWDLPFAGEMSDSDDEDDE